MKQPSTIQETASSLIVHRIPNDIPYTLSKKEEEDAIISHETSLKNNKRWTILSRGGTAADVKELVDDVDWSKEYNPTEVLIQANRKKYWTKRDKEIQKERKAKLLAERKAITDLWDQDKMFRYMSANSYDRETELLINDDTLPLIKVICYRLSDSPRFVSELGLDPRKGLLLRGNSGVGKSYLLDCVKDNPRHPVATHEMIEIERSIKDIGFYEQIKWDDFSIIHIADVGTEDPVINFKGKKIRWFKTFIESFYVKGRGHWHKLIISTNEGFGVMAPKYSTRVTSRLAEMLNIIDVKGEDLRKQKINQLQ